MNRDDLIARLEAATEGSRELDFAIAETVFDGEWRPYAPRKRVRRKWLFKRGTDDVIAYGPEHVRAYTTSIDAAVSLVNGLWWLARPDAAPHAKILPANPDGGFTGAQYVEATAHTPALAMSSAALKAILKARSAS